MSEDLYAEITEIASQPGFLDWLSMVRATGGCTEPIHLWGESRSIHAATGQVLADRHAGRLLVACGNRRKSRCPSCSEVYRADTFQLLKAGLVGGKGVPETVVEHPKVFATFTAPSFGPVHQRVLAADGKPKRCHPHGTARCRRRHREDDPEIGQPLDPDTYDYRNAVIWNALATRLWARTAKLVNRKAASLLGIAQRDWAQRGRVSVAKVAEYQARGSVHFHAIFRLDGPEPGSPLPEGATADVLAEAIRRAATEALVEAPNCDFLDGIGLITWGEQLDVRPVVKGSGLDGQLTDGQVAGYLAKYATKGTEASGALDRTLACRNCAGRGTAEDSKTCERCDGTGSRWNPADHGLTPHARRLVDTCWQLGGLPELEYLRLRPWAHMLGFRGHFSTKSRRYSTTLGCLRSARAEWRRRHVLEANEIDPATPTVRVHAHKVENLDIDDDVVLVIGEWRYLGRGHSPAQALFAKTVRDDLAESRRIWRQLRDDQREAA